MMTKKEFIDGVASLAGLNKKDGEAAAFKAGTKLKEAINKYPRSKR